MFSWSAVAFCDINGLIQNMTNALSENYPFLSRIYFIHSQNDICNCWEAVGGFYHRDAVSISISSLRPHLYSFVDMYTDSCRQCRCIIVLIVYFLVYMRSCCKVVAMQTQQSGGQHMHRASYGGIYTLRPLWLQEVAPVVL